MTPPQRYRRTSRPGRALQPTGWYNPKGMTMTIKFYRNKGAAAPRRFGIAHLPVRQTLIWAGPLFIRVAPR